MSLSQTQIQDYAKLLDQKFLNCEELVRITKEYAELNLEEAYQIQEQGIILRKERGENVLGLKMGLTSRAKMEQMGVESPICGVLTNIMLVEDGGELDMSKRIHPKVEPEVAFILGKDLKGEISRAEAIASVESVCAALEVIDSRYLDFDFKLPDVIADNCSSAAFVLSKEKHKMESIDLSDCAIELKINHESVQNGNSNAILGNPIDALVELAAMRAKLGQAVPAGSIILAGAATAAMNIQSKDLVEATVAHLGKVSLRVK